MPGRDRIWHEKDESTSTDLETLGGGCLSKSNPTPNDSFTIDTNPHDTKPRAFVCGVDKSLLDLLTASLNDAGFSCRGSIDAVDTLWWALAAPWDLIVADLSTPRLESLLLTLKLREPPFLVRARLIAIIAPDASDPSERGLVADVIMKQPLDMREFARDASGLRTALQTGGDTWTIPLRCLTRSQAARTGGATTIEGSLDVIRPSELCRLMHGRRCSGRVVVAGPPGRRGVIVLRNGEIVLSYVTADGNTFARGEAARAQISTWTAGEFSLDVGAFGTDEDRKSQRLSRPAEEAVSTPAKAPTSLGPFEVLETLSRNKDLPIYRARRREDPASREVRLVLDQRGREPRHPEALKRLKIPGVARLHTWGTLTDGRTWYESVLPKGPLLEEVIRERGPLPIERALRVFNTVLGSLAKAHALGLVHGGLDARRLVLGPGEPPVLLDFGLTHHNSESRDHASVRAMSPEAWRGYHISPQSDLYSVGVLIFFALSGKYPFDDDDPLVVCRKQLHATPMALKAAGVSDATSDVESFVARCLAKEPSARYASAEAASAALKSARCHILASATTGVETPPPAGYRLIRKLGEGAHGQVFEALHETLETIVAVKVIPLEQLLVEETRERFLREARLAVSIQHPGVVQILDARQEGQRLYLVMEFVDGESLGARIGRKKRLAEREAVPIMRCVLSALDAAHQLGIIHRDVKPDNIILSIDGTPKVVDFGLARSLAFTEEATRSSVAGTPHYMSPEQCLGEPVDGRADLYALGATFYCALVGHPPFPGEDSMSVLYDHVNKPVPSLESMVWSTSPQVASVIEKLLAKEPSHRFQSAREALSALPDLSTGIFSAGKGAISG